MSFPLLLRGGTLLVALCTTVAAQPYHWSVFAGQPPQFGFADDTGANARFASPFGITSDADGVIYVVEALGDRVRRISPDGVVTSLAGSQRGAADGVGEHARFASPSGITIAKGSLFVADRLNHAIRQVAIDGTVTTFAGRLGVSGTNNGTGSAARFREPLAIASDPAGNLYVADSGNHVIRKITPAGLVTTIAGSAGNPGSTDGNGADARFNFPAGIRVGSDGSLFVSDTNNHTVRKISPEGVVSTLAGTPGATGAANGTGAAARFSFPLGLLAFADGTVLVCDSGNDCVRLISPAGEVSVFSGRRNVPGSIDGPRADARFYVPTDIALTAGGLVVADSRNHSIRKLSEPQFNVTTVAGPDGNFGPLDGFGTAARFNFPLGIAVHASGDLYIADARGSAIRRVSPEGRVVTLVSGGEGLHIDGPAGVAKVNYPVGIAVAPDRSVYFSEQQQHTLRVLRPDGSVSTLAGTPGSAGSADGAGPDARFHFPSSVAIDPQGNLYVADSTNCTIRKIAAGTNVVTTFAGAALTPGAEDGTEARFRLPQGVATDTAGNVYVADWGSHTIRKITPAGVVSTLAGLAGMHGATDGDVASARFFLPVAIAVDAAGHIFVADGDNQTIRQIANGVVTTIGGVPKISGFADGTGDAALFTTPNGIAVDAAGNVYVTEADNNLVRRGKRVSAPIIAAQPQPVVVQEGSSATFHVGATGLGLVYQWYFNGQPIAGATAATFMIPEVQSAAAGAYSVRVANAAGSVMSEAAALSVASPAAASRIVNLSILSAIAHPGEHFTLGFVVGGYGTSGNKPLVIRAAGPSLADYGVDDALEDPRFEIFRGPTVAGGNDNWDGKPDLAAAMADVGAFAYGSPTLRDAATTVTFASGSTSVMISSADGGTGRVLAEVYDATPAAAFTPTTPRLVNVSVLKHIGSSLTAGFVIDGPTAKSVLVRAVGPTLAQAPYNVPDVLPDPELTLFGGGAVLATNDNWGGTAQLTAAFAQVGAFPLPIVSRDAALVATLAPGTYTVEVRGVGGTTGAALVEVYEMP